jgi:hypothetical protein
VNSQGEGGGGRPEELDRSPSRPNNLGQVYVGVQVRPSDLKELQCSGVTCHEGMFYPARAGGVDNEQGFGA